MGRLSTAIAAGAANIATDRLTRPAMHILTMNHPC
jgi:hypothetical protein